MTGTVQATAELTALERNSLNACRNEIREILRRLREQLGEKWSLVKGIGFADPGLVDIEKGFRSARSTSPAGKMRRRENGWKPKTA